MALEEIRQVKIQKLDRLKKLGIQAYPAESRKTHDITEVLLGFDSLSIDKIEIVLAGRVTAKREHGGSVFFDIKDGSGSIQAYLKQDTVGKDHFEKFNELIDIGDFIEAKGFLFKTKKNEKTLQVVSFRLLTKALLPLPEKWHGLQDVGERLRKRYLDLIMNPGESQIFIKKARFWQATREFLIGEGGLEVETPILEQTPGGADAEPFKTHMNALDIDLYLRISPELHLKRLIAAGFDKVFEIGRVFRNEGMDREHLQDYTQMEMYWAYYDYKKLMKLIELLIKHVINEVNGSPVQKYQGQEINWSNDWKEYDYYDLFRKNTRLDLASVSEKDLKEYAKKENIEIDKHIGRGRLIDVIFKKKVRSSLIEPGFLVLPPVDIEPLAKRWPEDLERVERFQVVAGGSELGKGFSELNDPLDQRQRFEEQMKLREAGDKEAQILDEDFIEALEYGMPPTAGFAYSERLFSFLTDRPVRENVFFPLMRPTKHVL